MALPARERDALVDRRADLTRQRDKIGDRAEMDVRRVVPGMGQAFGHRHAAREGDWERIEPAMAANFALAVLELFALARFADDVRTGRFPSSKETYHAADSIAAELARATAERTEADDDATNEPAPA